MNWFDRLVWFGLVWCGLSDWFDRWVFKWFVVVAVVLSSTLEADGKSDVHGWFSADATPDANATPKYYDVESSSWNGETKILPVTPY